MASTLVFLVSVGCGGGDESGFEFSLQTEFLPDFSLDTGYLPADQPVQVRLVATAGGSIDIGAEADSDGSPVPGSGVVAVEAGLTLEAHANVDVSGLKFEGLIDSFGYTIPSSSISFDPFLLDSTATLDIPLPAEQIASIPIASLPGGTLVLSVEGGTVNLGFGGTCAAFRDGVGQFRGAVTTGGTVELAATVVLEVPLVGTQEFGPFSIPVQIPALELPIDFGAFNSDGSVAEGTAPCDEADPGGGGGGGSGGEGGGEGGGGTDAPNCGVPTQLTLPLSSGGAGYYDSGTGSMATAVAVSDGGRTHILEVALNNGRGLFPFGIQPGIYAISGAETNPLLCSACVVLHSDDGDGGPTDRLLGAKSGTLTLVEAGPSFGGRLAGTVSGVRLQEYEIVDNTVRFVEGGCTTTLNSFSFDVALDNPL